MPIYLYRNLTTGETFEVEQRITEAALTEHPETGDPVKRLIQPVGIAFKGSGFYVTDSRKGAKSSAKSGAEAKSDGASKAGDASAGGAVSSDAKSGDAKGSEAKSKSSPSSGGVSSASKTD